MTANYYPEPANNPHCKCKHPLQALLCPTGHMLECHYPYNCKDAGCTHLYKSDYTPDQVEAISRQARDVINRESNLYTIDEYGQVTIKENPDEELH